MDYCRGGELTEICSEKANVAENTLKNYFNQIQDAVRFIHSNNVIHRDLKPNNILFLDENKTQLVIIDFGISGTCNGYNREIIKAGTLKYTPPEIVLGKEYQSSPKIDIWAMGIILYLMVFKTFPFDGSDEEVRKKICFQNLTFPHKYKKIKKSLYKLLIGMLTKDPEKRIDINSPLFEAWYNDESEEYEEVGNKVGVFTTGKYTSKYDDLSPGGRSRRQKNVPGYLMPTQVSSNKVKDKISDKNINDKSKKK